MILVNNALPESPAQPPQPPHEFGLDEICRAAANKGEPVEVLTKIVGLIKDHCRSDVCSVYLIQPDRAHLVLAATVGLRQESVGQVRMNMREGLTGLVAEQLQPIVVEDAARHPRFKFFPEAGEEGYRSFLGVPLVDQGVIQGVLVIQTAEPRAFSRDDVSMLAAIAGQVVPLVSEVRTLQQFVAPVYERIWALARNLWWSWDADAVSLFRELDPVRWRELDHNPVALLKEITLEQLEQRAGRLVLHSRLHYAHRRMQEYLTAKNTWGATHAGVLRARPVAYFSAEFGLHESIPIYSGGLGLLAGDHVKSASDLGVPLVGIGLFYDQGYFRQRLDASGWQQEDYFDLDVKQLPLELAIGPNNQPVKVAIETRQGTIVARVWRMAVGRSTLLLLDSDVEGNAPEDRELTARLYGGDHRVRIRQELLLGVGGVRVLRALKIHPGVLHLNEGHSAFAVLEMIRHRMETEGLSFDEGRRRVASQTVFTTHTPVPGVAPADVYKVLRSDGGIDRAFAKLDELKPNLVFWDTGAEMINRLASGEYAMTFAWNGRIVVANEQDKRNFKIAYPAGFTYVADALVIVKGSPNIDKAYELMKTLAAPEPNAEFMRQVPYSSTHKGAADLLTPERRAVLPLSPENLPYGVAIDDEFWAENYDSLTERLNAWAAK